MNENNSNDLQSIITQAIEEMKSEQGSTFDLNKINLAELGRRAGLSRAQLRRLKKNEFRVTPMRSPAARRIQLLSPVIRV